MGGHQKAFERLSVEIAASPDPDRRDALLDQWLVYRDLATNWDADQWGLNPDDPMWQMPVGAPRPSEG